MSPSHPRTLVHLREKKKLRLLLLCAFAFSPSLLHVLTSAHKREGGDSSSPPLFLPSLLTRASILE